MHNPISCKVNRGWVNSIKLSLPSTVYITEKESSVSIKYFSFKVKRWNTIQSSSLSSCNHIFSKLGVFFIVSEIFLGYRIMHLLVNIMVSRWRSSWRNIMSCSSMSPRDRNSRFLFVIYHSPNTNAGNLKVINSFTIYMLCYKLIIFWNISFLFLFLILMKMKSRVLEVLLGQDMIEKEYAGTFMSGFR